MAHSFPMEIMGLQRHTPRTVIASGVFSSVSPSGPPGSLAAGTLTVQRPLSPAAERPPGARGLGAAADHTQVQQGCRAKSSTAFKLPMSTVDVPKAKKQRKGNNCRKQKGQPTTVVRRNGVSGSPDSRSP